MFALIFKLMVQIVCDSSVIITICNDCQKQVSNGILAFSSNSYLDMLTVSEPAV